MCKACKAVGVPCCAGNTNTLAGNIPPKANLGDLSGLASGLGEGTTAMIDGLEFDGAKARSLPDEHITSTPV